MVECRPSGPAHAQPGGGQGGGGGFQALSRPPRRGSPRTQTIRRAPARGFLQRRPARGRGQFDTIRNAGFTTTVSVGRNGIFNGRSAIIDLAGDSVSAILVKDPYAEHISFATIPGQYPGSLLGTFSALRQMFYDAQRLQEWKKAYATNPRGMKRPAD
jgi:hypothetical protein